MLRSRLRISLSARAAVAIGQPFAPRGDPFSDAGVARDEIVEPRRIPRPRWKFSDESLEWSLRQPLLDAWETCHDGSWMLHVAVGVKRELLVSAACACARAVINHVPGDDPGPRLALDAAEAWVRGEVTAAEVERLSDVGYGGYAEFAAASAAHTVRAARAAAQAADYAASEMGHLGEQADPDNEEVADDFRSAALREYAGLVRAKIPTIAVLRFFTFGG